MPTFVYEGKSLGGEPRKGEIEAANLAGSNTALRRQTIIPTSVSAKKAGGGRSSLFGAMP